jgi:hypothetical protein
LPSLQPIQGREVSPETFPRTPLVTSDDRRDQHVAYTMMPLRKADGGRGDTRSGINSMSQASRSGNYMKMKPVKLPKTRWITKLTT